MSPTPVATLKDIFRPWWVRWCAGPVAAIGVYDTIAGQAELPTLRKLFGMSSNLLPWWGWLLLLQAIFVAALFEYVRRNVGQSIPSSPDTESSDTPRPLFDNLEEAISRVGDRVSALERANAEWDERLATVDSNSKASRDLFGPIADDLAAMVNERRKQQKEATIERLQQAKLARPSAGKKWHGGAGMMSPSTERGDTGLSSLLQGAVPRERVMEILRIVRDDIKGQAIHCTILQGEDGLWHDEKEKQRWVTHNAVLDALIAEVKRT